MSTTPAPTPPAAPTEIKVFGHSTLFYWWPVWTVCFILAALTYFSGTALIVVPAKAEVSLDKIDAGELLIKSDKLDKDQIERQLKDGKPKVDVVNKRSFGVIFVVVFLVVVLITNVPLRGLWSVLVIGFIVLMSVILALLGVWETILGALSVLDIRINLGGYVFISLALLIMWSLSFFFFDRQVYITFQPGQMKVCLEIGEGEKTYDTVGMTIERERSDLFRHLILGIGSGDLIIKTSGADRQEFRISNVLGISKKVHAIQEMQRVRQERKV